MRYYRVVLESAFKRRYADMLLIATDDDCTNMLVYLPNFGLGRWAVATAVDFPQAKAVAGMFHTNVPDQSRLDTFVDLMTKEIIRASLGDIASLPPLPPEMDEEALRRSDEAAHRLQPRVPSSSWKHTPVRRPQRIPAPRRLWSPDEWERIRRGHLPTVMEDHWFAYTVGRRLHLHRSWTGVGVYDVHFRPINGYWMIDEAFVSGDPKQYGRGSDHYEALFLEVLIRDALLQESWEQGREWVAALSDTNPDEG